MAVFRDFWGKMMAIYWECNVPYSCTKFTGIILCMRPTNERWRYSVTSSLIGWEHSRIDPRVYILLPCSSGVSSLHPTALFLWCQELTSYCLVPLVSGGAVLGFLFTHDPSGGPSGTQWLPPLQTRHPANVGGKWKRGMHIRGRFKNTHELLNLRALTFSPVNKNPHLSMYG